MIDWRTNRLLQAISAGALQQDPDLRDVQGVRDAPGDGFKQWTSFGELTGLLGKLAQDLLGGINLAEESAVDPGREAPFAAAPGFGSPPAVLGVLVEFAAVDGLAALVAWGPGEQNDYMRTVLGPFKKRQPMPTPAPNAPGGW